ncbi:MAG: preprotein translocase subunit SecE [Pseudomonadota bacterium]
MVKGNPAQFVRQVRKELAQVVWPTRKETGIGTIMVFAMAAVMSVFFLLVDQVIAWAIQLIVG